MKYMLLMYANELKGPQTPEEQEAACSGSLVCLDGRNESCRGVGIQQWTLPGCQCDDRTRSGGQGAHHRRSLCRNARAIGRILLLDCKDLDEALQLGSEDSVSAALDRSRSGRSGRRNA